MQQVISDLQRLRRRSRLMLLAQRCSVLLAWMVGALAGLILLDYLLRFPSGFRLVLLLAGLAGLGGAMWRYLGPAVVFGPSLTQLALRVERVFPAVTGRLASSVEFATAGVDQANPMAARCVRETQRRLSGESLDRIISFNRTWRDAAMMLAVCAAAGALLFSNPAIAATGLDRIFLPYSSTNWPARTGVQSMMSAPVHPRGQTLALRASVTKGAKEQRVDAHYRLKIDGSYQPWQRIVLTHQGGGVHERLVDTNAQQIELYFSTDDDRTSAQAIELVPPPAVRRATLTVSPPPYAAGRMPVLEAELGQGIDDRAVTSTASLAGSTVNFRLELNKPLPAPQPNESEWIKRTFRWEGNERPSFSIDPSDPAVWILGWTLKATRSLHLNLVDEHGLANTDPIGYRIEAVEDHPPTVTITEPQADEAVLATAVVALESQAHDDVALAEVSLEAYSQTAQRAIEEALEQKPAWTTAQTVNEAEAVLHADLDLAPFHLVEGDVVLISGIARDIHQDVADPDANDQSKIENPNAQSHTVRSALRRLRVIDETEFATQLRRQLGAVRQNAIRIEALQSELQDDVIDDGMQPGMERAQAQLGERIAGQRTSVEDIERSLQQNRLDDPQLGQILQQTQDLLDFAGRSANKAVEEMEQRKSQQANKSTRPNGIVDGTENASQTDRSEQRPADEPGAQRPTNDSKQRNTTAQPPSGGASSEPESHDQKSDDFRGPAQEDRPIVEAQQEVRDELADLIKLLDRDEDTWVVKRQLEDLLKQQAQLEAATSKLGQQTMGQRPQDLSEQQRTELDRIAQKQRDDLRDEARNLIENMRDRAKSLEDVDPQSAESMRSAADTAEQRQLDRDMEEAARHVEQNQMTSATARQQSAQSTMQQMLNNIDESKRAHAQQLIRQLASLIESIQRLITVQENELIALALAQDTGEFGGLDRSMIRLNQNTQAVAGEARAAGQEARRIARSLDRAADTQGAAVVALRAEPPNAPEAQTAENRSLELLKEAKALAEELQKTTQDQELQKRREELMAAYRTFAERQVALRDETHPLSAVAQLDRRQLVEARRLGAAQDEIRTGMNELRDITSEIMDSPLFVYVHRSIDTWSTAVSDSLVNGTVNVDVTDRQLQIADSIGRLIKSLEESMVPPEEFVRDQQQGNQGGQSGQQQPLIPPVAQLKLLQGLQEQVYNLTKEMDGRSDLDAGQRRSRLRDLGQQQRELMDLGRQMLEALQETQPPVSPEAPDSTPPEPMPEQPKPANSQP